ncbi:endonuclease NucS domain-containing protein [Shewanella sp. SP2S2-6]|uniref:endonuclease NucS domain-containing protein n=1 Tax=Shewanella sp. SP2S2-6 TaxID=3063540 RepID=UPI00390C49C8
MTEAEIRTLIAKNIKGFNPKLELIEEEFKVEADDGTKGSIDILAKDNLGYLTIIELKKSKHSERSAIQQLFKYSAMLKDSLSIPQEKIRRIIISTDWRELRTPFAEFSTYADYPINGYKLTINDGQLSYEKIILEKEDIDKEPATKFHLFKFSSQKDRTRAVDVINKIASRITELNLLVFNIELNQPKIEGCYPHPDYGFGIIIIFFSCAYESVLQKLDIAAEEYTPYGSRDCLSEKLLVSLAFRVRLTRGFENKIAYDYEYERLASFSNYLSWYPVDKNYISFGKMFSRASLYMSKDDVLRHANGVNGIHPYLFEECSSTENAADFLVFRQRLSKFIAHNSEWQKVINYLLNNLGNDEEIRVFIFNPLNIIALINDYISKIENPRVPKLYIEIEKSDGQVQSYIGTLMCEGRGIFSGVVEKIQETYGSVTNFKKRLLNNTEPKNDEKLSTILGLKHFIMSGDKRLLVNDGQLEKTAINLEKVGLHVFFLDNIQVIDEVARFYNDNQISDGLIQFSAEDF